MYKSILRSILFRLTPEKAHSVTMNLLKFFLLIPGFDRLFLLYSQGNNPHLKYDKKGLRFPNRVGLAAGFDKDAKSFKAMRFLGFGSV